MNTISQYAPKTVIDLAKYSKDTLAPLALKHMVSVGIEVVITSWLFGCNREDVAVASILRRSFEAVGDEGLSYLERNFKLDPTHQSVLKVANTGLSFFTSYFAARAAGYQLPPALIYNASISAALQLYLIKNPIENPFKDLFSLEEDPYKNNENIIELTKTNFQEKIQNSKLPTIVNVYASWYPPCRKVAPIFADAAKELEGKVNFAKINVDQDKELIHTLKIRDLPTFLFFKDGKEIHNHTGMTKKEHFSALIKKLEFVEESKDVIEEEQYQPK